MRVAPEGIPFILVGSALLLSLVGVAWYNGGWWWLGAAAWVPVALWIPCFFRDPVRKGPRGPDLVLAPADGRIVDVAEVNEPAYMKSRALRVSIFMNVLNVHVNRCPVDGSVEYRDYRPGRFFNATLDKASQHNERMSLGVRGPNGPVLIRQIAGLIARRIVTDHEPGASVRQGERLGLIRFGSRVETFIPAGADLVVGVGERTFAGETVLARWQS